MATKKMILDLDTGVDDALALAYGIADPAIDLIGVVASYGNNLLEQTAKNSLQLLELLGQNVPVFKGLEHSSTSDHFNVMQVSKEIHGNNGIGDISLPEPTHKIQAQAGVDFIIEAAHQYGKDLIIVPTGPLTNLAAALRKDPQISHLIGNVTLMGGALTVEGNVSDVAEANINQDAKAANEVFTSSLPITMVGLDVTLRTLLTKKETAKWRQLGTKSGTAYADLTNFYIDAYYNLGIDKHGCAIHDPLAVGVAIDPTFVTTLALPMKVITEEHNYARTIGDKMKLNTSHPNVNVAINVDKERFVPSFMEHLTSLLANH
ncbi:nucleoside hydrolase [Limosilactobacillus fastidiosus]|uniref:Nucleoside hydrolase n=1 Tax=Limosilactobacillus fastidiosus TaxID=2759855 RepID=A0A7W3TYV4_9LACO|nr:nucleoside hydrolase [Limosilactobacillus fastidiosus]MBB1063485.1 nucleoside hydrolase [Limosilactobacillus fastidiosus]MBB1085823.1 nucleoside hydrolase [Limosilactobacillus fastidiosus]MCD7084753.1 nucleoside hydrolase [Limosilactobacillus fastidiosus]MCD7085840.1 nucleoside hydrolase [Limosilactobacillus fastidiosus]MCD7113917.1 nucleoside hydrolase [Limosilactobacillus fastidiosus]